MPDKLFNRNFFLLWQGQLVSLLGSRAFTLAAMYWLMETTNSASLMGLLMVSSALPAVLFGPIGGTLADRYPRRAIIIVTDLMNGLFILGLTALFYVGASPEILVPGLFATVVVTGCLQAFFQPAIRAAVPDLVPSDKVAAANSLTQFSAQASTIVGQGLGGILYRTLGVQVLFLVNAISYLFSAASEALITIPEVAKKKETSLKETLHNFLRETREGLDYVWNQKGMRLLLLVGSIVNFMITPVLVLLPFYVELFLGESAEWYGFLLAAISVGTIIGYVFAGTLKIDGDKRGRLLVASLFGTSALLGSLAFVQTALLALALMFLVGVLSGMLNIYVLTALQTSTETELRGRVMSVAITLAGGIAPLGMMAGGLLGDLTDKNIPLIYAACGSIAALITLAFSKNKDFRGFLAGESS